MVMIWREGKVAVFWCFPGGDLSKIRTSTRCFSEPR